MVKHTITIRRQKLTNCLSVFDQLKIMLYQLKPLTIFAKKLHHSGLTGSLKRLQINQPLKGAVKKHLWN